MSKSSSLSRNKMTTTPVVGKRSTAASVLAGTSKTSKLRTELRRVMSDRVLKITRCSQQQNVKQKDNTYTSSLSQNRMSLSQSQKEHTKIKTVVNTSQQYPKTISNGAPEAPHVQEIPIKFTPKETSPKLLAKMTGLSTTKISPNAKLSSNKISLQPIKTFDLKDKKSLIDHIITAYNDVVSSQGSIILAVQSIINSITHYIKANQLDLKSSVEEILKENLLKSNIEIKQKYPNDELSEKLKLEGQLQVLLQIENYIILNQSVNSAKIKVDDDWVWDIANQIRWLKQKFKDFKIERFLFGEIYANYYLTASDFICSLMEELGYDKEDNGNESSSSSESPEASPSKNLRILNDSNDASKLKNPSNSAKFLSQLSNTPLGGLLKEESNSSFSIVGGVNSLFEEESTDRPFNDCGDHNDYEENSQNPTNEKADILDEFIKKKTVRRSEVSQSSVRSIVIQKKRTRLKIRSPFKSPSKGFQNKRHESRRSPRIKDKQIIQPDMGGQKRPRTYLITDTPDHKQNSTIITTRQEKLRKRFSFQQFTSAAASLPSVPDTPVKGETIEPPTSVGATSLFPFQKIYPSPSKAYLSPQKTPQKIYGSPLKVYATPSPSRKYAPSPSHAFASPRNFVSPLKRSPAKRVIFR